MRKQYPETSAKPPTMATWFYQQASQIQMPFSVMLWLGVDTVLKAQDERFMWLISQALRTGGLCVLPSSEELRVEASSL